MVHVLEPNEVVRQGLGSLLSSLDEIATWRPLSSLTELHEEGSSGDVAILSASGLDLGGAEKVDLPPGVRTIVLIPSADPYDLERCTAVRANGYMLLRDVNAQSLRTSLLQVKDDRMPLPPEVAAFLLDRVRGNDRASLYRSVRLTPRERDVLDLLVVGRSNQQIAHELGISIHGAKRHVSSLLNKMNSPSRAHLVSIALQCGILNSRAPVP